MRAYNNGWENMRQITKEELLNENIEFINSEYGENSNEEKAEKLDSMMKDLHPLKFESEEEEEAYIEWCRNTNFYNYMLGTIAE